MLVLSRKLDQDILIGDNIRIRILKVKGNTIRLGIDAPRDVKVMRGELPTTGTEHDSASVAGDNSTADVTVVFSNENSDRRQSQRQRGTSGAISTRGNDSNSGSEETVRFRAPLPMSLQHNRLKELVKELTR